MQIKELIKKGERILTQHNISSPHEVVISILKHKLKWDTGVIYANYNAKIKPEVVRSIFKLIERRANHEPLQYILGEVSFMGLPFKISPPIFIPRPETEELVETTIAVSKEKKFTTIVDIGCGSGVIAIALAKFLPNTQVYGVDIINLKLATLNAQINKVEERVHFLQSDLFTSFKFNQFDAIVGNLPYIPTKTIPTLSPEVKDFEALSSLDGGEEGLYFIFKVIREAKHYLKKTNPTLLLEFSPEQNEKVKKEAKKYFKRVKILSDLSSLPRILLAED